MAEFQEVAGFWDSSVDHLPWVGSRCQRAPHPRGSHPSPGAPHCVRGCAFLCPGWKTLFTSIGCSSLLEAEVGRLLLMRSDFGTVLRTIGDSWNAAVSI